MPWDTPCLFLASCLLLLSRYYPPLFSGLQASVQVGQVQSMGFTGKDGLDDELHSVNGLVEDIAQVSGQFDLASFDRAENVLQFVGCGLNIANIGSAGGSLQAVGLAENLFQKLDPLSAIGSFFQLHQDTVHGLKVIGGLGFEGSPQLAHDVIVQHNHVSLP
jgi:hypothetical protein